MAGDQAGARAAYQDFLALWKDADPELPALKEAKAEHRKPAVGAFLTSIPPHATMNSCLSSGAHHFSLML